MPTIDELRLKTGQVITEDWYTKLADILTEMRDLSAVNFYGYVYRNLNPVIDLEFSLGSTYHRFKEVHMGYGFASYNLFVAGKPVIKSDDPINIARIFVEAQEDIREAVKFLKTQKEPYLLAKSIDYVAPDFTDIFSPDILVPYSGRVRAKITGDAAFYLYAKFIPKGEVTSIISHLAPKAPIDSDTWVERDFTVIEGDKVNFRISPSAKVTILVYNLNTSD